MVVLRPFVGVALVLLSPEYFIHSPLGSGRRVQVEPLAAELEQGRDEQHVQHHVAYMSVNNHNDIYIYIYIYYLSFSLSLYIYIEREIMCVYVHIYIYTYIHTLYISRGTPEAAPCRVNV